MNKPGEKDDFNWVKARIECSLKGEFVRLRRDAEKNLNERQAQLEKDHIQAKFSFDSKREQFTVIRETRLEVVEFRLFANQISVYDHSGNRMLCLTLTLNDEGECRYKIDGKGEFQRWQVLRRALEDLFFPSAS